MRNLTLYPAALAATVAMVAPAVAEAQEAEMAALSAQVTIIADGASVGYTGGRLTPATVRQVRLAMRGVIQGALAANLTWTQIQFAVSRGLAQSQTGVVATEMAQVVGVAAYDAWIWLLTSVQLPAMPLWILLENPGYIEMAHIYLPFEADYWGYDDYGSNEEGSAIAGGGGFSNSSGDSDPSGDRPKTKYDSSEHENGYWVAGACFPPVPDVHWYNIEDATVPCTGNEVPAPMTMFPLSDSNGNIIGAEWVSTIPLGQDSEALLLLPIEGSPAVPTVVHWF